MINVNRLLEREGMTKDASCNKCTNTSFKLLTRIKFLTPNQRYISWNLQHIISLPLNAHNATTHFEIILFSSCVDVVLKLTLQQTIVLFFFFFKYRDMYQFVENAPAFS